MIDTLDSIVWLQTGFLGDIIITTAAFRRVREQFPHLRQYLITTTIGTLALKDHPDLDGILEFDKRGKSLWSEARKLKGKLRDLNLGRSVMLQTHRSFRSSFLCRLIGLPTITYFETHGGFLASRRVFRVAVLHEAQRILLLLEALGADRALLAHAKPYLEPIRSGALYQKILTFAAGRPLVGIAPGSVWGTKRWPSEYYGELASRLLQDKGVAIVILGSKDEVPAAAEVETLAVQKDHDRGVSRVLNLAGQTNLHDLRAIIPLLQLLVSNDSSPLHYASAFRTPTLALFGATVPALGFGPLAPRSEIAEVSLDCRPCGAHGPQTCPLSHFKCMRDQEPSQVFARIEDRFGDLLDVKS